MEILNSVLGQDKISKHLKNKLFVIRKVASRFVHIIPNYFANYPCCISHRRGLQHFLIILTWYQNSVMIVDLLFSI